MLWKMSLGALFPVVASIILYIIEKKTAYSKLPYILKQTIAGIIFGGIAILGTEYGIPITGAVINVRDAAPLCAGLLFGAPAGIIAGVIGGVERWFSVLWGIGSYTRIACSISTVLAGVFGAMLRKYMFDDKKPSWYYGLAIGLVTEVVHMVMIFLTNMNDIHKAFAVVRACAAPMILFTGASVMLAVLAVTLLGREKIKKPKDKQKLAQTFQRWLLVDVIIAFLATSAFTIILQTGLAQSDAISLLELNISDVRQDINDASDENLLSLTHSVVNILEKTNDYSQEALIGIAEEYGISEIDIIDDKGIITSSTIQAFVGFDMHSGEQSKEFLVLLNDKTEYVQSYQPISYDTSVSRKYGGVALAGGGFVQVGYDAEEFHQDISSQVIGVTRNRHVGSEGCIIVCGEDWNIVSDPNNYEGENLYKTGIWINRDTMPEGEYFLSDVYGEESYCMYEITEGYLIIAVMTRDEAMFSRDVSVYVTVFMEIIVFAAMFALIYFLVKKLVVENIQKINDSLAEITGGNLNVSVNVRTNEEFASLSDDINSTVDTLKRYIDEAAARIDKELEFARSIQLSALPSVFPPFPNRTEFDLHACMDTAKEVGGDFYDFYMLDGDRLAFLIADVSGKGIPAAMFMMTSKTMLKNLAETGMSLDKVFDKANAKLAESNEAMMFVTVWMGIYDINSGKLTYVNAGHNPPLIKRAGGNFEYLRSAPGLILAIMDDTEYTKHELTLQPGDEIFLYTDGVTEAMDENDRQYGEERLKMILDGDTSKTAMEQLKYVLSDVRLHAGKAEQSDDITMLALKINKTDRQ